MAVPYLWPSFRSVIISTLEGVADVAGWTRSGLGSEAACPSSWRVSEMGLSWEVLEPLF